MGIGQEIKVFSGQSIERPVNISMLSKASNIFGTTGRLTMKQPESTTELPMRIRGKNNETTMEKGYLEMSNADLKVRAMGVYIHSLNNNNEQRQE